jgi:ATP-binding cassette, subfamily B, bacterial MsbA
VELRKLSRLILRWVLRSSKETEIRALSRSFRFLWSFRKLTLGSIALGVFVGLSDVGTIGLIGVGVMVLGKGSQKFFEIVPDSMSFVVEWVGTSVDELSLFLGLVGAAVLLQVVRSLVELGVAVINAYLIAAVDRQAKLGVVEKTLNARYEQIAEISPGELATAIGQAKTYTTMARIGVNVMLASVRLVIYMVGSIVTYPIAAVGMLVVGCVLWFGSVPLGRRVRKLSRQLTDAEIEATRWAVEVFSAPRLTRVANVGEACLRRIQMFRDRQIRLSRKVSILGGLYRPLTEIFTILMIAGVLFGSVFVLGDKSGEEMGRWFIVILFAIRMRAPIDLIIQARIRLTRTLAIGGRVEKIMALPSEPKAGLGGKSIDTVAEAIELKHVSFSFGSNAPALIDISFGIKKGEIVALVGPSGAGKSTIVSLLLGLYQPVLGNLLVDGTSLREIDLSSWRSLVGTVDQQITMFSDTVRENISFGRPSASPSRVAEAAKLAHAAGFIEKLPKKYETQIGQYGGRFSGGEKQRLAIARALFPDPPVLILDEATSALDPISERLIKSTVESIKSDKFIILIAHRRSTIAMADRIIFLEGGRLVEQGKLDELLENQGAFSEFWRVWPRAKTVQRSVESSETVRR